MIFCPMEDELCFCFVAALCLVLYPLVGCSNSFVVVNRPRIRIM